MAEKECCLSSWGPCRRHTPYVMTYVYMSHMHVQQTQKHTLSAMCCRDSCNRYYIAVEHMCKYMCTHDTQEITNTSINNTCTHTQNTW